MASKRRSIKQWQTLISEMESSGLTQKQWCAENNMNYHTFKEARSRIARSKTCANVQQQAALTEESPGWVRINEPSDEPPRFQDAGMEDWPAPFTRRIAITIEVSL
ncbi:MAG: hypothetical protein FWF91_08790 [Coriobacteriia bacterium]|nr:hypothetical protein [Coriobacteriia bacterium]